MTFMASAPTRSQTLATWFMNDMCVARMALAAYLVISLDRMSMVSRGAPVRIKGAYNYLPSFHHSNLPFVLSSMLPLFVLS
jgi:hypothetical protein